MKVSVCCITYNHANFIAESIESFLMQHVDFEYEIVIGEDSSSDETRDIVECFQKKYPDKIFLLPSDKRYGMVENFKRTLRACKGEFIAVCEGDDYWTDPHKLIKQVEVLEQNRDLSFTFHDVNIVGFDGEVIGPLSKGRANMQLKNAVLDSRFVIGAPLRIVHLASLLFRKKL